MMMEYQLEVDAIGLKCPLPILKCKKAISGLNQDEILKILTTDKGSIKDFQAFCKQTGHELLSLNEENQIYTFFIKKR
jgi:tRNA 2-thiouridine synthesizing protein A